MTNLKFANIVLNDLSSNAQNCNGLYYLSNKVIVPEEDGSFLLTEKGEYDFTTYFNSLSVHKLETYTRATSFYLHIEVSGNSESEVERTYADNFSHSSQFSGDIVKISPSDSWQEYNIPIHPGENDIVEGFAIRTAANGIRIKNCYWSLEVSGKIEPVKLALITPTFKKENYIEKNISYLKSTLFKDPIAKKAHFFCNRQWTNA